jgi:hypothetical protein
LTRGAAGKLLGLHNPRGFTDEVVEGETRAARMRQLPLRAAQFAFELLHPRDQGLEAFELVVEHKADRTDDAPVDVLDRDARDHELLLAELHDVEQDWLSRLHHAAHQAVRDNLLNGATDDLRDAA